MSETYDINSIRSLSFREGEDQNIEPPDCNTCRHYSNTPNYFNKYCLLCKWEYFEETNKPNLYEPIK